MILVNHLDSSVVLDIAVVAACRETIEVSSIGQIGGIPEIVIGRDVLLVEDAGTPFVVDVEGVDGITQAVDKVKDDEAVVDAVAIGRDHIIKGERAVAMVTLPKDK